MNEASGVPLRRLAARPIARPRRTERGSAAVEFVVVFPAFFMILYAIVTYSLIFVAQQNLTLAAEEGARAALNYQQAASPGAALGARASAACTAASNMVASLVSKAQCTTTATSCSYDATMKCVNVTLTYDYSNNPLIPALPLWGLALPASLQSSAMVQLNPENIL
ncbi:TadE family protein [Paraburkholderia sp.]|jgi:Flp pilus assembly protein TadG|uniref:TadE/TadG family type IV pilus assembly protein n=1 Tax=Paraburkholderia sp. TaxID=1926495 RepID=UPI002F41DBCE